MLESNYSRINVPSSARIDEENPIATSEVDAKSANPVLAAGCDIDLRYNYNGIFLINAIPRKTGIDHARTLMQYLHLNLLIVFFFSTGSKQK